MIERLGQNVLSWYPPDDILGISFRKKDLGRGELGMGV